jgi:ATP-dependent helicase/nuclease subunit A
VKQCHRTFLASAGTGKTYRLSGRYLDLLLAGAAPSSILATTFTRKAAEEILSRVLKRLVEAIDSPKARHELEALRDFGDGFAPEQALRLLVELVRTLNRFEVRTLDSFFNHIAQLYPLELGLPPAWSVGQGSEADEVTNEALARLLEEVHGREREVQFAELLREIASSNGASRSIHYSLTELVQRGREVYLDSPPEAWKLIEAHEPADPERVASLVADIAGLEVPMTKGKPPVPKKHWGNAHEAILSAVQGEDWKGVLKVGLFNKFAAGEEKFDRTEFDGRWTQVLGTLKEQVASELLANLAVRNERAWELLDRYEGILDEVKRERGQYEFADIPRILAPRDAQGVDPITSGGFDLAYRMDGRLSHLLLDEFQDTSPTQWRVLDRMAKEICSDGTGDSSFFCVGDVKQSIYGWRSAEPRLLTSLEERLFVTPETLKDNYRSSAVVLGTVDQVFEQLDMAPVLAAKGKETYREAAALFVENFKGHTAAKDLHGLAELRQAPPPAEGQKKWEPTIDLAVERVAVIAERYKKATIGVLVRSNRVIPPLIAKLQQRKILASGEGGNPLTDSAAVLHFLSLLHLADHPSDTLAAFHLTASPMPAALGFSGSDWSAAELSREVRLRLSDPGLGQLCADLEHAVREHAGYNDWDRRRYRQLGDLAFSRAGQLGLRADQFVDLVRVHKVEDAAAGRIKVMTVHASKGLEFDAVVLPELDVPLARNRWPFLVSRPDPRGLLTEVTLNPGKDLVQLDSECLKGMFEEQSRREVEEALCVLYVGMTRAKHHLELLVRDTGKSDGGTSSAGLLRAILSGEHGEEGVLWRHRDSEEDWWPKAKKDSVEPGAGAGADREPGDQPVDVERAGLGLAPSTRLRRLPSRAPSSEEGGLCRMGADLLAPTSTGGTRWGSLIHHLFEILEWPGTDSLIEEDLLAHGVAVEPDLAVRQKAVAYLRRSMEAPEIRTALSPAGEEGSQSVWRERTFCQVMPGPDGSIMRRGAFDRVVLQLQEGRVVGAVIQDYKTDAVEEQGIQAKVDYYRPQLGVYRDVLAGMTGLDLADIRAELLFLKPGLVREVTFQPVVEEAMDAEDPVPHSLEGSGTGGGATSQGASGQAELPF